MGFWETITGANAINQTMDIAEKTTDGVISGIDKIFYSPEEKAETLTKRLEIADKIATTHIKLMQITADETTTRSINRRIVASYIMIINFIFAISICLSWKFDPEWANFMLKVCKMLWIGEAFTAVVIFYFGNYLAGKFLNK